MSGAEALWGRETMGGLAPNAMMGTGGNRLDTEMPTGFVADALPPRAGFAGRDVLRGLGRGPRGGVHRI